MPTHGSWRPCVFTITGAPFLSIECRSSRLDDDSDDDILPGRNAAEDPARLVAEESLGRHFVRMLGAALRDRAKPGADLDALDGVDAHHRVRDVGVEPVVDGLAPADGNAARPYLDAGAARIARFAQPVHEPLERRDLRLVRGEKRIAVDVLEAFERNRVLAEMRHVPANAHAVPLAKPLARDRPGGDAHGRFTR